MLTPSSVRSIPLRPLQAPLLRQAPAALAARDPALPARPAPAHGSVADRARIAQRLLAFGSW